MLEDLWDGLIKLTEPFVVPDWGSLVNLIPIGLAALLVLYLTWTMFRYATAAPTRRGGRRRAPAPPPGLHMPGPSFAPIIAAFGATVLVACLVVGGPLVIVGVVVLAVTLLYWGREALREYDRIPDVSTGEAAALALPAPVEHVPPPGVHMPPPSFRPILVAVAMTILVWGLVVGGWGVTFGLVAVLLAGLGWLRDARREYAATEAADRTGHLDLGGAPSWPIPTLATLAVIVAVALLLTSGVLPNSGGGAPAASGGPASAAPGGGGGGPSAGPSLPAADVTITAENIAFTTTSVTAPAGRPFTIAFDNRDQVPHNVHIKDAAGGVAFDGEIVTGPKVVIYQVPALTTGTYPFVCTVHPNMTGTITAQ